MKSILLALAILFATGLPTYTQSVLSGATGTWRVEGIGRRPWTVVLNVTGSRLTGTVSSCASHPDGGILPAEIYEGNITGSTVGFKCKNLDGSRTITFMGLIKGDEVAFTYEQQVRDGAPPSDLAADGNGMFGASTPPRFIAKRVEDGGAELAAAVNLVQKGVKVEGTLFLPQKVARVRSVIVLINAGTSWQGLAGSFYVDPALRTLSATLESSLLLLRVTNISQSARMAFVHNAGAGAADGLLTLLDRLALESGHQELTNAPLLLWGHSAGGSFAATFAALHAQRTIAVVRYHQGGGGLLGADIDVLSRLPVLLLEAGKDQIISGASSVAESLWKNARSIGARWTFGVEPDASHQDPADLKKANDLLIPWITAVLRQRVSPNGGPLRVVTDGSAWLGNSQTGEVASYGTFSGSKPEASWLPDETTARGWQVVLGVRGSAK